MTGRSPAGGWRRSGARAVLSGRASSWQVGQSKTRTFPVDLESFPTGIQAYVLGEAKLLVVEIPVLRSEQIAAQQDSALVEVDSDHSQVEEGMDISAQQETVRRVVRDGAAVGADVRRLERVVGVIAGHRATVPIGIE